MTEPGGPGSVEGENPELTSILDELFKYNNLHGYLAAEGHTTLKMYDELGDEVNDKLKAVRQRLQEISENLRVAMRNEDLSASEASWYRSEIYGKPDAEITAEQLDRLKRYLDKVRAVYRRLIGDQCGYADGDLGVVWDAERPRN